NVIRKFISPLSIIAIGVLCSCSGAKLRNLVQAADIAPPAPSNFTATVDSYQQIHLSWSSGGSTTATFAVKKASGSTAPTDCNSADYTGMSAATVDQVVTGLSAHTTYSFRLCAYDSQGTVDDHGGVTVSSITEVEPFGTSGLFKISQIAGNGGGTPFD